MLACSFLLPDGWVNVPIPDETYDLDNPTVYVLSIEMYRIASRHSPLAAKGVRASTHYHRSPAHGAAAPSETLSRMQSTTTFSRHHLVPEGRAMLACSFLLPDGWVNVPIPDETYDLDNPSVFVPLVVCMAPFGAVVFTIAARPAFDDGTVQDWAEYLGAQQNLSIEQVQAARLNRMPCILMDATMPSEAGLMRSRSVFLEDGRRLYNIGTLAPEQIWPSVQGDLARLLGAFALDDVQGLTVPPMREMTSQPTIDLSADTPVLVVAPVLTETTDAEMPASTNDASGPELEDAEFRRPHPADASRRRGPRRRRLVARSGARDERARPRRRCPSGAARVEVDSSPRDAEFAGQPAWWRAAVLLERADHLDEAEQVIERAAGSSGRVCLACHPPRRTPGASRRARRCRGRANSQGAGHSLVAKLRRVGDERRRGRGALAGARSAHCRVRRRGPPRMMRLPFLFMNVFAMVPFTQPRLTERPLADVAVIGIPRMVKEELYKGIRDEQAGRVTFSFATSYFWASMGSSTMYKHKLFVSLMAPDATDAEYAAYPNQFRVSYEKRRPLRTTTIGSGTLTITEGVYRGGSLEEPSYTYLYVDRARRLQIAWHAVRKEVDDATATALIGRMAASFRILRDPVEVFAAKRDEPRREAVDHARKREVALAMFKREGFGAMEPGKPELRDGMYVEWMSDPEPRYQLLVPLGRVRVAANTGPAMRPRPARGSGGDTALPGVLGWHEFNGEAWEFSNRDNAYLPFAGISRALSAQQAEKDYVYFYLSATIRVEQAEDDQLTSIRWFVDRLPDARRQWGAGQLVINGTPESR